MMAPVAAPDPCMTVEEPAFVARFLVDPAENAESVANVDVFVDLPDGSCWALTIFTVDEVRRLLAAWRETGEVPNGSYFWAVDRVIVPEPGVSAMTVAIRELVRSGEMATGNGIDHVIMGAGLDLEDRLAIIREIFRTSEKTTVHMKDSVSGAGRVPAVRPVGAHRPGRVEVLRLARHAP
jgi:hypothetical protein